MEFTVRAPLLAQIQLPTLTGLRYGEGVREFPDRLVVRGLARRQAFLRDRGHVYHLHHASTRYSDADRLAAVS